MVTHRGLKYDRRWMLVDNQGAFLTQRTLPKMVLLQPSLWRHQMVIRHMHRPKESITVSLEAGYDEVEVDIWGDRCVARLVSQQADRWFSEVLGLPCKLVYMAEQTSRIIKKRNLGSEAFHGQQVSFADGVPYLIIGEGSMQQLNKKLKEPMSVHPFRPNFTFSGGDPHCEDEWMAIRIGSVRFKATINRARCQVITVNPQTGRFRKEPLKTLAAYRRHENEVFFGKSLMLDDQAGSMIKTGDEIVLI